LFQSDVTVENPTAVTPRSKSGTLLVFMGSVENPITATSRSKSGDFVVLVRIARQTGWI
jgi:hypothetical protein